MRIALLVNEYVTESSFAGGLANYTHRVAKGLKQLGHEPIVIVRAAKEERFWYEEIEVRRVRPYLPKGIRFPQRALGMVIKLPFRAARKIRHISNQLSAEPVEQAVVDQLHLPASKEIDDAVYLLSVGFGMRKALKDLHQESPVDVAHYTHLTGMGTFRFSSIPSIVRLSSYRDLWLPYNYPFSTLLRRILEDIALRRADHVIGPSNWVANYVRKKFDIPVTVVESPFVPSEEVEDWSVFEQQIGAQTAYGLYFGSFAEWKGVLILAEAVDDFLQQHPNYSYVFVGKNAWVKEGLSTADYLRQRLGAHAERVKVMDKLKHAQLFPIIQNARFVSLPSLADNFPNTCLEAMWSKRVTIGTEGRSFEQLIEDGENGFLCEPGNVASLRAAIEKAALLPEGKRVQMGRLAKERIALLSPENVVADLLKVYQSVAKLPSSGAVHS